MAIHVPRTKPQHLAVRDSQLTLLQTNHITLQEYQTTANNNKTHNARTHTTWLEKYTPDTVRLANNARRQLSRIAIQPLPAGRKHHLTRAYHRLKDVRILKKPQSAYSQFIVERYASGDFQGATIAKSAGQLRDEWKALGEGEKQVCFSFSFLVLVLFIQLGKRVCGGDGSDGS